jgi:hypothetical protein
MQHESTRDDMSIQEHTMMSDSSKVHVEMYGGIQRGVLPCMEETHIGENADATPLQQHMVMRSHLHHFISWMGDGRWRLVYQQWEELLLVIPEGWGFMMAIGEKLSWVQLDIILVYSLVLTEAGGIFHPYNHLHRSLLPFPNTSIMENNMRRGR